MVDCIIIDNYSYGLIPFSMPFDRWCSSVSSFFCHPAGTAEGEAVPSDWSLAQISRNAAKPHLNYKKYKHE